MENKSIMQSITANIERVMVGQSGARSYLVICMAAADMY